MHPVSALLRGSRKRLAFLTLALAAVATAIVMVIGSGASTSRAATADVQVTGPDVAPITSPHTITWDSSSFAIDGQRVLTWSGEFHYFRLPSPYQWTDVLEKIKAAGFNAVSLYFDWEYHSPAPGVYDFTGVRDVNQLLNIANDLGIYVWVRPGPYINAELDDGGLANWVLRDTSGGSYRLQTPCVSSGATLCPTFGDFDSAAAGWLHAVDSIIVNHQITNGGGSVIGYQNENENSGGDQYMADMAGQIRSDGITVPLFVNNANLGGAYVPLSAGGTGGTRVFWNNIYGYDNYPQGFNCTSPYTWSAPGNNEASFRGFDTSGPVYIPEFQGGSFDNWGPGTEAGYAACNTLTNSQFERVFYLTNTANGTTMQSNYMTFGGTSWGWEPVPSTVYSSYDYGSAISEGRLLTPKYYTVKELGFQYQAFPALYSTIKSTATPATAALNISPATTTTCTNGVGGSTINNCGAISVVDRVANGANTGTNFFFVDHTTATGTLDSKFQIGPVTTTDGTYSLIPQFNATGTTSGPAPSIELNGRDDKMLVANDNLDSSTVPQHLVYSTSDVMTDETINGQDVVLSFLPSGQSGETDLRYSSQPTVTTLSGTAPTVTWAPSGHPNDLVIDYKASGMSEVQISGGGATTPLLLLLADEPTAQMFWNQNGPQSGPFTAPSGPILEQGPELVRTSALSSGGTQLDLTGDTTGPTTLTVWPPAGVTTVTWNGNAVPMTANNDGSLSSTSQLGGPPTLSLPPLNNWIYQYETPETQTNFNDSQWTLANSDITNNGTKPAAGQPVLYADDYGFHHGFVWYRYHFTSASALTGLSIAGEPGQEGAFVVWLNGHFLGDQVIASSSTQTATFTGSSLPAADTNVNGNNVIAVLVEDMGHNEASSEGQPRGVTSITTTPSTSAYQPQTTLAGAAAAGATSLKVLSNTSFAAGQKITVGSGANAEQTTISSVGTTATPARRRWSCPSPPARARSTSAASPASRPASRSRSTPARGPRPPSCRRSARPPARPRSCTRRSPPVRATSRSRASAASPPASRSAWTRTRTATAPARPPSTNSARSSRSARRAWPPRWPPPRRPAQPTSRSRA